MWIQARIQGYYGNSLYVTGGVIAISKARFNITGTYV